MTKQYECDVYRTFKTTLTFKETDLPEMGPDPIGKAEYLSRQEGVDWELIDVAPDIVSIKEAE